MSERVEITKSELYQIVGVTILAAALAIGLLPVIAERLLGIARPVAQVTGFFLGFVVSIPVLGIVARHQEKRFRPGRSMIGAFVAGLLVLIVYAIF
jgi:biotin transporter BioY